MGKHLQNDTTYERSAERDVHDSWKYANMLRITCTSANESVSLLQHVTTSFTVTSSAGPETPSASRAQENKTILKCLIMWRLVVSIDPHLGRNKVVLEICSHDGGLPKEKRLQVAEQGAFAQTFRVAFSTTLNSVVFID